MSAAFNAQSSKEANAKQHQKYPNLSAEMRRRAEMRKTHSGGRGTKEQNSRRAKLGWEKRRAKAKQASSGQETAQSHDRTEIQD